MNLKFTYLYIHLFKSDVLEQFQPYKQPDNNIHTHILMCIPSSDVHVLGENINIRKGNSGVTFRW
jgi:hypothetical protein